MSPISFHPLAEIFRRSRARSSTVSLPTYSESQLADTGSLGGNSNQASVKASIRQIRDIREKYMALNARVRISSPG